MLFHQRVLPVKGNGMKVQVKRVAPIQAQAGGGVKPKAQDFGVTGRIDAATVLGQKGTLGDAVETGKQGQALVQDLAHDVAVAGLAHQFQGQKRAQGGRRRNHAGTGKAGLLEHLIEGEAGKIGQEEKQTGEASAEAAAGEIQLAHIGHRPHLWAHGSRALLVAAPRQSSKSFLLQNQGNGDRTQGVSPLLENSTDVIDGKILLA